MKNPKVSVIIPTYNAERTLRQCLDSVMNQTYKNYEVIVVDNGSVDKTKEVIGEFQKKDGRIKYLFEARRGRGAARYAGEINAKGSVILTTDSDCIVPKNWIKEMIKPIIKNRQKAVQGTIKSKVINYWTKHIQRELDERVRRKTKKIKLIYL